MRIGLELPNSSRAVTRENILRFVQEAERLSYDSLWVSDRLLYPVEPRQLMGGGPWSENTKTVLDPLETLTFAAALTEKIRLGTSILDLPFYSAAQLAKRLATLDVLSNGRLIVRGGIGWSEDEAMASGIDFHQRGKRTEEIIGALKALWGDDPVTFEGEFNTIPKTLFNPKPVQKPHPRLLLGGFVPAVLERAARLTDGFMLIAGADAAYTEQAIRGAQQAWQKVGRDGQPEIIMRVNHSTISDAALDDQRPFLCGSVAQVAEDVGGLAALGVNEIFFSHISPYGDQPDGFEEMMRQARLTRAVV